MHPAFAKGEYDTHFIPLYQASLLEPEEDVDKLESIAMAASAVLRLMQSTLSPSVDECETISRWKMFGRSKSHRSIEE